jgi:hypothetical protein
LKGISNWECECFCSFYGKKEDLMSFDEINGLVMGIYINKKVDYIC